MLELDINEVFQPSAAIRTGRRELFFGREGQIAAALAGLASEGSSLCILGERGIGKTSLTWRVKEFISGDREWLFSRVNVPFKVPSFDIIWLEVLPSHANVAGIIADLVSDRGRSERFTDFSIANELSSFLTHHGGARFSDLLNSAALKEFSKKLRDDPESKFTRDGSAKLSESDSEFLINLFRDAIEEISRDRKRLLLIVLDEIDRLPDKSGLGDLIKTGNQIRFCIVGVADQVDELIIESVTRDHPSAERKIFPILVERLGDREIDEFMQSANAKLTAYHISFTQNFISLIRDYSEGFPYILHRLSRDALLRAMQDMAVRAAPDQLDRVDIDKAYFFHALDGFINPRTEGGQRYNKLVSVDNTGKESLLFELASFRTGWVMDNDLAKKIDSKYGFAGNLIELETDGLIKRSANTEGHPILRFIDPVMRAIVKRINARGKRLYKKKQARQ